MREKGLNYQEIGVQRHERDRRGMKIDKDIAWRVYFIGLRVARDKYRQKVYQVVSPNSEHRALSASNSDSNDENIPSSELVC